MAELFVNNHFLKLRQEPNTTRAEIALLHAGHRLKVLDASSNLSWARVECTVEGQVLQGWTAKMYLRPSVNAEVDRLVETAGAQYRKFKWGTLTDSDGAGDGCALIEEFWKLFPGNPHSCSTAWSGVFVTFVVKSAGLTKKFAGSPKHTVYMSQAKKDRMAHDSTKAYWAFRPEEEKLRVGDIVGAWRDGSGCPAGPFTYDSLPGDFCSHCDVVIALRAGKAMGMGGNVSNTVKETEFELDANGFLVPVKKRFVVLRRQF
ncbi:MAG: SH3 domain-containing C40 family peptidase [Fimbriimonadaceae bacterium]